MAILIQTEVSLEVITCYKCGLVFGLNDDYKRRRVNDKASWFCPNGHEQYFIGKTEADRLRAKVADLEAARTHERDQRLAAEANVARLQKAGARAARRAAAGVCPCCQRTVTQMARHMKTKHPEFGGPTS